MREDLYSPICTIIFIPILCLQDLFPSLSLFVSLISILFSPCCVSIILTVFHSLRPSASISLPFSLSFTIKQALAPLFYFTSLILLSIARKTLYLYHTPKTLRVLRVRTLHIRGCYVLNISSIIYNDGNYNKCWTGFHGNKHAYFRMISSASLYFYSPFFLSFFCSGKAARRFYFYSICKN